MEIKYKVGVRVDQLRKQAGFSKTLLAWDSNLDPSYVMQVINGKRDVSLDVISKLCVTFKITVAEFFNDQIFER